MALIIGVEVEGTLTWVSAVTGRFINGYTGKPIDPIYD